VRISTKRGSETKTKGRSRYLFTYSIDLLSISGAYIVLSCLKFTSRKKFQRLNLMIFRGFLLRTGGVLVAYVPEIRESLGRDKSCWPLEYPNEPPEPAKCSGL